MPLSKISFIVFVYFLPQESNTSSLDISGSEGHATDEGSSYDPEERLSSQCGTELDESGNEDDQITNNEPSTCQRFLHTVRLKIGVP